MTIEQRIEKARNKLAALLAYASCSLGTNLADSETWPTERRHEPFCMYRGPDAPCACGREDDEPITTEYDLWYVTRKDRSE